MSTGSGPMVGFGYKQAWLAVRDTSPERLTTAMGLRDLGPLAWRAGIDLVYFTDDRLVLTPPLPGADGAPWTLVVGQWLLSGPVDITDLSASLGTEVQSFASHRVLELHRWRRARHGELIRGFGYLGETGEVTEWQGEPDDAELAAHLPSTVDDEATVLVDESDVMAVAGAWSLNPTTLDGQPAPGPLYAAAA
jgi:hypothetical protein